MTEVRVNYALISNRWRSPDAETICVRGMNEFVDVEGYTKLDLVFSSEKTDDAWYYIRDADGFVSLALEEPGEAFEVHDGIPTHGWCWVELIPEEEPTKRPFEVSIEISRDGQILYANTTVEASDVEEAWNTVNDMLDSAVICDVTDIRE